MADQENNEVKREIPQETPEIPEAKFSPDNPQLTPAMENLGKEGAKALAIDWTKVDNWSRATLAVFFSRGFTKVVGTQKDGNIVFLTDGRKYGDYPVTVPLYLTLQGAQKTNKSPQVLAQPVSKLLSQAGLAEVPGNTSTSSSETAAQEQQKSPVIPLTDQVREWDNRVADMQPADKAELFFSLQKNTKTSGIISKDDFYASILIQTDNFLDSTHFEGDRDAFYKSVLDSAQQEKETEIAMRKNNGETERNRKESVEIEKFMESEPNDNEKKS